MTGNKENTSISIDSEIIETIIGENTSFAGKVQTDKTIMIYGTFDGTIDSTGLVIISDTARFKGQLTCRELRLFGFADGNAVCTELCKIAGSGVFKGGKLSAKNLVVAEGSQLDAEVEMGKFRTGKASEKKEAPVEK